jgi:hypothetical protein
VTSKSQLKRPTSEPTGIVQIQFDGVSASAVLVPHEVITTTRIGAKPSTSFYSTAVCLIVQEGATTDASSRAPSVAGAAAGCVLAVPTGKGALKATYSGDTNYLPSSATKKVTFTPEVPAISSVVFSNTATDPTVTITGSGFGDQPAGASVAAGCGDTGLDYQSNALTLEDTTLAWYAGIPGDCIGINLSSYTDSQVVYTFGSGYGTSAAWTLNAGDGFTVEVDGATSSGIVEYEAT